MVGNRVYLILHCGGLGSLVGAAYLQLLVFWTIWEKGKFVGGERVPAVLAFEVCMSIFAIIYLGYLYVFRWKAEVFGEGY